MTTDIKECTHRWTLESPDGPFCLAQCNKCEEYKVFRNTEFPVTWPVFKEERKQQFASEEDAMKDYLKSRLSGIKKPIIKIIKNKKHISVPTSTEATASNTLYTAEFKEAAIKTAREYKNITKAAEDLNMPRRTLRGWIEKYEPMDT